MKVTSDKIAEQMFLMVFISMIIGLISMVIIEPIILVSVMIISCVVYYIFLPILLRYEEKIFAIVSKILDMISITFTFIVSVIAIVLFIYVDYIVILEWFK